MQPDNPKLTAYVLDELSATDRNAVHSELARNPALAAEAEGLRRTADQLRRAFATAEAPALSGDARRAILGAGVAPVSAAGRPETAAVASRSESAAGPDKLETVGSRTRAKKPIIVRLRRTFRWAACFAVLIGATYLLGLAAWTDTHPSDQFELVRSTGWALSYASPDQVAAFIAKSQANLRQESNSTGLILPTMQQSMGLEGRDRLLYPDLALSDSLKDSGTVAGVSADAYRFAGGLSLMSSNGNVTLKQHISPSSRAQVASGAGYKGGYYYDSHDAYMLNFEGAETSGDERPEGEAYTHTLNQDTLTGTAGEKFSAPLQFVESAGQEVQVGRFTWNVGDGTIDDSLYFQELYARFPTGQPDSPEELGFELTYGLDNRNTAESYSPITDNPFVFASKEPVSTFSIDVDTASYSNIRRHLLAGQLPPKDAVRIEEMINAFRYDYPEPTAERPFSVNAEVGECPWAPAHRLVRVGLQGYQVDPKDRPPLNLVFLIDVSGSMQAANKLPLVRDSLKVLLEQLWAEDRVGIVTYAGESAIALPSTPGSRYDEILAAIDALSSGGSTNGEAGIREAYLMAEDNFIEGGVNRVMLCTDGDFNVGVSDDNELVDLIRVNATSGVFLTVLGFGTGNLKDGKLEALADKGNGHYAYIDDLIEAKRVLGDEAGATLQTIAKDVKIQVQFNPARVQSYRLIGYENRVMAAQDFADDAKDAGEIGAGHSVTALYEVVPASGETLATDRPAEEELSAEDAEGAEGLGDSESGAVAELRSRSAGNAEVVHGDAKGNDAPLATGVDATPAHGSEVPLAEHDGAATADGASDSIAPLPADALLLLRLRYKAPDGAVSQLIETPVFDGGAYMEQMPRDFLFAASVASFGMLLRQSPHVGDWTFEAAEELAHSGVGDDASGYRTEFVQLVRRAIEIRAAQTVP